MKVLHPISSFCLATRCLGSAFFVTALLANSYGRPVPHNLGSRSGGANDAYTLVFIFDRPVATASFGTNANEVRVELTGVTNAQHLTVTLSGVQDTNGGTFAAVPARMDVLAGDVNATGLVDGNDVSGVQGQTRNSVDGTNFKFDVDLSGLIDGNDVSLTQSQTRNSLP